MNAAVREQDLGKVIDRAEADRRGRAKTALAILAVLTVIFFIFRAASTALAGQKSASVSPVEAATTTSVEVKDDLGDLTITITSKKLGGLVYVKDQHSQFPEGAWTEKLVIHKQASEPLRLKK
ncbi:hypothetical protein HYZ64_02995 [Candidatus Berkelbacteria bacterium]|nr:hypothetical protein [Candidatus Berkelbacteria bacterium]